MNFLVFVIDDQLFAFDLDPIDRVIPIVELTPLPNAPPECMGAINMHGKILPVINMREVFGLPIREIELEDHLLICTISNIQLALWIDAVKKLITTSQEELIKAGEAFPKVKGVQYIIKDAENIIFVFDISKLLPLDSLSVPIKEIK